MSAPLNRFGSNVLQGAGFVGRGAIDVGKAIDEYLRSKAGLPDVGAQNVPAAPIGTPVSGELGHDYEELIRPLGRAYTGVADWLTTPIFGGTVAGDIGDLIGEILRGGRAAPAPAATGVMGTSPVVAETGKDLGAPPTGGNPVIQSFETPGGPPASSLTPFERPAFVSPTAPDFTRVEDALGQLRDPTMPAAPTQQDLLQASLAGAAEGSLRGNTVGQVLAGIASGAFNAKDMKQTAYEQKLDRYEAVQRENARTRASALAQIDIMKAEFDKDVALARNNFELNVADQALRHDVAQMNERLSMLQLTQPQFHVVNDSTGVVVTRSPDGGMQTQVVELDPLQKRIKIALAQAQMEKALRGSGAGKSSAAIDFGAFSAQFGSDSPLTAPLQMAAMLYAQSPDDPRVKSAQSIALAKMAEPYGGLDEEGGLPAQLKILQLQSPEEFNNTLTSMAIMNMAGGIINDLGREQAPQQ